MHKFGCQEKQILSHPMHCEDRWLGILGKKSEQVY